MAWSKKQRATHKRTWEKKAKEKLKSKKNSTSIPLDAIPDMRSERRRGGSKAAAEKRALKRNTKYEVTRARIALLGKLILAVAKELEYNSQ